MGVDVDQAPSVVGYPLAEARTILEKSCYQVVHVSLTKSPQVEALDGEKRVVRQRLIGDKQLALVIAHFYHVT